MRNKLPKNWVETELNQLATIQSGGTPSRGKPNYWNGDIPWVKISDIKNWYIKETTENISLEGLNNSSTKIFNKGTILFTIFATIGKVGVLNIDAATNQAIAGITPINEIEHKFLVYSLIELSEELKKEGKGIAQKNINLTILKALKIPLPPKAEQERIVTKLDTIFNELETVKKSLENIPSLIKNFRQAILTQAVTGKLTEKWRVGKELEDVKIHFEKTISKRILAYNELYLKAKEKGERKPRKIYLDKLPEIEKINVLLPKKWKQTNIHFLSFVTKLAGFEYSQYFDMKPEGEIPVVRAQNVQMGKFVDKNRLYIKKEISDILTRSQLFGNELLMVFIGAGTGNISLAPTNERWHLAPNVAKIDVDCINKKYLYYYLQSNLGVTNVLSRIKATAQPSLSMETIREIVTLVPPLQEQAEIVKRVEKLFTQADKIEQRYEQLKNQIDSLPQAILAKAFKGELVAQLPTDGNAQDLLKEIQTLKASLESKPKKKPKPF